MKTYHLLIVSLLLVGHASSVCLSKELSSEDQKLVKIALGAWISAYNSHDAAAVAKQYTEDAIMTSIDGSVSKGRAEIEKSFAETFAESPHVKSRLSNVTWRIIAPGVIAEDGAWEDLNLSDSSQPSKGLYTAILVKRGQKWLSIHEHSFVPAVVAKPQATEASAAKLSAEHEKLREFIRVGNHSYQGETDAAWNGTEYGPTGKFSGTTKVRSVGPFLLEEWEESYPTGETSSGIIVYGYDAEEKEYRAEHFMSSGLKSDVKVSFPDSHRMTQEFEQTSSTGEKSIVRAHWKYKQDMSGSDAKWELSFDNGKTWKPWIHYKIEHTK